MKKNKMMRLASAMMVLTLMSTSVISGTFAKYVTQETGTDSARVAKWGVTIIANGTTFAEIYDTDDNDVKGTIVQSVVSTAATDNDIKDNVIAPGTTKDMVAMTIAGTPEVAVSVDYEATLELTGWNVTGDFDDDDINETVEYCPIIFTVNGNDYKIEEGTEIENVATLIAKVKEAIEDYSADYPANQNLATESTVETPDVTWTWAFEGNDDEKDTCLGDQAADGTAATISLTVKTTVTQID